MRVEPVLSVPDLVPVDNDQTQSNHTDGTVSGMRGPHSVLVECGDKDEELSRVRERLALLS